MNSESSIQCSRNNPLPDGKPHSTFMKYTGDKTSEREQRWLVSRSKRRDCGCSEYWSDSRKRWRGSARVSAEGTGAPGGTENTVVVLGVPGERNVCEKHIVDVPTAVNFLRVDRTGSRARSRRAFYLFISRLATISPENAAGDSSTGARWEPRPDIAYCSLEPLGDVAAFFWTRKRKSRRFVMREHDFSRSLTATHRYSEPCMFLLVSKFICFPINN